MSKLLKIGIVGCGAIGSSLAKAIVKDFSKEAQLTALYDLVKDKSEKLSLKIIKNKSLCVNNLNQLIKHSDFVIECAHANSSFKIARNVLSKKRSIMIMSVGGIVESCAALKNIAKKQNARIYIPSGAISGVDALKAASLGGIKEVVLTTRKNPIAFKGVEYVQKKGIKLNTIKKDKVLFEGAAKEAVKFFPQNVNVAAVLSLAGIGANKTKVVIIASPETHKNIHEIKIISNAATIATRTENILHPDNPKTSFLAVLSAIAVLKQILESIKIGT